MGVAGHEAAGGQLFPSPLLMRAGGRLQGAPTYLRAGSRQMVCACIAVYKQVPACAWRWCWVDVKLFLSLLILAAALAA